MNFFHAVNATPAVATDRILQTDLVYEYDAANYAGTGTTFPDAQGNLDLTISGATYKSSGPWFEFDGVNDSINSSTTNFSMVDLTMGVWFNMNAFTSIQLIYAHWQIPGLRGAGLYWNSNVNALYWRVEDNNNVFDSDNISYSLSANTWYYVVGTYLNSTRQFEMKLYGSTGLLSSSSNTSITSINTSAGFSSCATILGGTYYLGGLLGECHTYDAVLTNQEILDNYNSTKARYGY